MEKVFARSRPMNKGKQGFGGGGDDGDLRPVGITDIFIPVDRVIVGRNLFGVVGPVVVNVVEIGQFGIRAVETEVEGRIEYDPVAADLRFDDVVRSQNSRRLSSERSGRGYDRF